MSFAMQQLVASAARPAAVKASRHSQRCQATSAPPSLRATSQRRLEGALRGPRRSMNVVKLDVEVHEQETVQLVTAAATKKQPSQSRRTQGQRHRDSTSRGPRSKINFVDLDELLETSGLVPICDAVPMRKQCFDSESHCTTAPPSAESSPLLTIMDDAPAWPSLREASNGFDFCSDCSDDEEFWELPGPALAMEDEAPLEAPTSEAKFSYADSVRHASSALAHMLPPVSGTRAPPPFQLRSQGHDAPVPASTANFSAEDDADVHFQSTHGWTKAHKASHSKKQQRKVAGQQERRASQRMQSRGCQDIED